MCDCCGKKAEAKSAVATAEKCEKGKDPKSCSAEQIRECHGDAEHACAVGAKR